MKATGIVRRIDDLGRVVIPKEIRRTMRIREGDPQQTALEGDAQEDAQMLLALLAGVIIASPVVIWEIWGFIKPALYPQEKRKFRLLFVLALLLFLTGVVFCYFAVYSLAVDFFLVAGDSLATPMLSIDKYVSFLFGFLVPFGVAFQLPVVLYLTTRVGLTTPDMLRSKRKYVILAIFVLAAILTPPDVVSQVALGLPMCGLYEIGILVSRCTKARERA